MNVKGLSTLFIAAHLEQHGIPVQAVTLIPPEEAEYENAVIDLTDTVRVIHAVPSPGGVGLAHVQTGTMSSEAATPSSGSFCETLDALLSAVRDALGTTAPDATPAMQLEAYRCRVSKLRKEIETHENAIYSIRQQMAVKNARFSVGDVVSNGGPVEYVIDAIEPSQFVDGATYYAVRAIKKNGEPGKVICRLPQNPSMRLITAAPVKGSP